MTRREELEKKADKLRKEGSLRRGQALMSALYYMDGDVYQTIVGTPADCYYLDVMIPAFYALLNTIWSTY